MDLKQLYQDIILEHGKSPRNFGICNEYTHEAKGHNPLCGDQVQVYLKLNKENKLENLTFKGSSMKVAQLAGYVAEQSNYHHGEQCLFDTITKMAHNFPGSNNIEYLFPDGQFGSRLLGGKDAANARYIFTKLAKNTRAIFPKEDDELLKRIEDDGDIVEPHYYLPIIPMVLVNGCNAGIGTGWSCSIPQYNPIDLIDSIQKWLNGDELPELSPWYRGFNGVIQKVNKKKFMTMGKFSQDKNKYVIEELPINMWTDKYKEFLENLMEKKKIKTLKNYKRLKL